MDLAAELVDAAPGDVVTIPPGVHSVVESLRVPAGVTLLGAGRQFSVLQAEPGCSHVLSVLDASGVALSGFTVDASLQRAGHGIRLGDVADVVIADVLVMGARVYGVGMQVGTNRNVTVERVRIVDSGADGMDLKGVDNDDVRVDSVTVEGFGRASGVSQKAGIDIRGDGAMVTRCRVTDGGPGSSGIRLRPGSDDGSREQSDRCIVSDNIVERCRVGVTVTGEDAIVANLVARDCEIGVLSHADRVGLGVLQLPGTPEAVRYT